MAPPARSAPARTTGPWDWLTETARKKGFAATLVVAMLAFGAYQVNRVMPVVTNYVTVSGQNNEKLVAIAEAQVVSDSQTRIILDKLADSVVLLSQAVTATDRRVELNSVVLKQLADEMKRANDMMRDAPTKRQEQTQLLQQIKAGIDKLIELSEPPVSG